MYNKKILIALAAVFGISSTVASLAVADYDYGKLYGYEKQAKPLQTPKPVYNAPDTKVIYTAVPVQNTQPVIVTNEKPFVYTGIPCPGPKCKKKEKPFVYTGIPCKTCPEQKIVVSQTCDTCEQPQEVKEQVQLINYVPENPAVLSSMQKDCCLMAPIALDHVDFRIKSATEKSFTDRLGKYRFRIFGCRRYNKEARLNSGNIMEKNINFASVFDEALNDCYKVLPMPKDLCLQTVPTELPEYVLTAEITDYYMNICDEYDWNDARKKEARSGTSEITVTWRLMNLSKNKVFWKGESTGYGEVYAGENNGETKLIERAFADASNNLRALTGFDEQLMQRVDATEMAAQRYALIEEERALNPIKCGYVKEYECAKKCQVNRPGVTVDECCSCGCTPACETGGVIEQGEVNTIENCIDENGKVIENGACHVVDDTWVDTGAVKSLDNLCIVATDACKALTPETMYRLRSSVVEIVSPNGRKGAGLLISDRFILTSGDLVDRNNNNYTVKTVRDSILSAHAVRVNPSKNTALLMMDTNIEYTPLALNLSLPEVGKNGFLTLGILDIKDFKNGENYLENSAKIEGYRYTEEKGAEILANTFIQNVTVGGALFYKDCTVSGMAHSGVKTNDGLDVYIPTETALRSLGISICGHEYVKESPWQQTVYKPVTEQITVIQKAPEPMKPQDRK